MTADGGTRTRAESLIEFCDGMDEAGMTAYARRARQIARDNLELLDQLENERSARRAIQQRHDAYVAYHQRHCFNRDGTQRVP